MKQPFAPPITDHKDTALHLSVESGGKWLTGKISLHTPTPRLKIVALLALSRAGRVCGVRRRWDVIHTNTYTHKQVRLAREGSCYLEMLASAHSDAPPSSPSPGLQKSLHYTCTQSSTRDSACLSSSGSTSTPRSHRLLHRAVAATAQALPPPFPHCTPCSCKASAHALRGRRHNCTEENPRKTHPI